MIVTNSNDLKLYIDGKKTAVALGSFDALHKGHTEVIGDAVNFASQNHIPAVVQLVEIPCSVRVNTLEKRLEILEKLGADIVVVEEFSDAFKSVGYRDFVSDFLAERYNAAAVFSGDNYRFGHNAEGDTKKLEEECRKYGIRVFVKNCIKLDKVVSSTEIRGLIQKGKMEKVTEYMGRPFAVSGEVVHGRGIGRTIGFPTANINMPEGIAVPKDGVYLSKVLFDGMVFYGITNIGAKPTVDVEDKNIETFIKNYKGNLYGKNIEIQFLRRIRDIRRFENLEELKKQLETDKRACQNESPETEQ